MSIIKDLAARFGAAVKPTEGKNNAVTPVYEDDHIKALTDSIDSNAPEWLQLWFHISIETAGRTTDIASLRFENLDYETGELKYVVAKQSKAALARAARKGVEAVRKARMEAADDADYRKLASMDAEDLALSLTPDEETVVSSFVGAAKLKTDSKFLSPVLVSRIQKFQGKCLAESSEFMFPASCTGANRSQALHDQPVSRQTVWRSMKPFMEAVEKLVTDMKLHLSAYSTRKIAAYLIMKAGDLAHPGSGIGLVMEFLGHSSVAMSRKYLGLDKLAAALQRNMQRPKAA